MFINKNRREKHIIYTIILLVTNKKPKLYKSYINPNTEREYRTYNEVR